MRQHHHHHLGGCTREYVWLNPAIRTQVKLQALSVSAFGLWTEMPFIVVEDPDGDHLLPSIPDEDAALMAELVAAGFVEPLPDGAYRMTALSRQFYSFTEPVDEGE